MPHKRILIVDDDDRVLTMLEVAIEHLLPDSHIVATQNGSTALADDLIVTDYQMLQMDCLDFAQAARQNSSIIPATAGYSYDEIQAKAGSENLTGFLTKLFTLSQFRELFRRAEYKMRTSLFWVYEFSPISQIEAPRLQ